MMRGWSASFIAVLFTMMATPAAADGWGDDIALIADDEMADLRGGIAITPDLIVNFGAQVTTYVNGTPALVTTVTWTDMGQFVEETVGDIGESLDALTPEQRASLGIDGLENPNGVVIDDADGVTALVHNVTDGALQNIIINTAAGRDLRQEVDITLELPGFEAVQQALTAERIGIGIDADLRSAMIGN
jgi:hypothetical protein